MSIFLFIKKEGGGGVRQGQDKDMKLGCGKLSKMSGRVSKASQILERCMVWGFTLRRSLPKLIHYFTSNKDGWVAEAWEQVREGGGGLEPRFSRQFNDWELEEMKTLL